MSIHDNLMNIIKEIQHDLKEKGIIIDLSNKSDESNDDENNIRNNNDDDIRVSNDWTPDKAKEKEIDLDNEKNIGNLDKDYEDMDEIDFDEF